MAYRLGNSTILKATQPEAWRAAMQKAIKKHAGNMRSVAREMDVGYSTIKRWFEDAQLKAAILKARGDAGLDTTPRAKPPAKKVVPVRRVRRRRLVA